MGTKKKSKSTTDVTIVALSRHIRNYFSIKYQQIVIHTICAREDGPGRY